LRVRHERWKIFSEKRNPVRNKLATDQAAGKHMSNRSHREPPDSPAHPWMIYFLIAIAAFASGSVLTNRQAMISVRSSRVTITSRASFSTLNS
jgi:hypothetical protein